MPDGRLHGEDTLRRLLNVLLQVRLAKGQTSDPLVRMEDVNGVMVRIDPSLDSRIDAALSDGPHCTVTIYQCREGRSMVTEEWRVARSHDTTMHGCMAVRSFLSTVHLLPTSCDSSSLRYKFNGNPPDPFIPLIEHIDPDGDDDEEPFTTVTFPADLGQVSFRKRLPETNSQALSVIPRKDLPRLLPIVEDRPHSFESVKLPEPEPTIPTSTVEGIRETGSKSSAATITAFLKMLEARPSIPGMLDVDDGWLTDYGGEWGRDWDAVEREWEETRAKMQHNNSDLSGLL